MLRDLQLVGRYPREADFRRVEAGMTRDQVLAAIGAPAQKDESGGAETWTYSIWRGETPGFLSMLRRRPVQAVILDGRLLFRDGKVVSKELVESSARPLSEALSRPGPAGPSSSPASE